MPTSVPGLGEVREEMVRLVGDVRVQVNKTALEARAPADLLCLTSLCILIGPIIFAEL